MVFSVCFSVFLYPNGRLHREASSYYFLWKSGLNQDSTLRATAVSPTCRRPEPGRPGCLPPWYPDHSPCRPEWLGLLGPPGPELQQTGDAAALHPGTAQLGCAAAFSQPSLGAARGPRGPAYPHLPLCEAQLPRKATRNPGVPVRSSAS